MRKLGGLSFEQHTHVAYCLGVNLLGCKFTDARSQAALDVELQAWARMFSRQVDFAGGNQEVAMNQVDDPVCKVRGEVGAEVRSAILAKFPGYIHSRKAFRRELHVRVSFVIAQQNVIALFLLLYQIVLKRQGLALVGHHDVLNIYGFAQQAPGLRVFTRSFDKVGPHPRAQVLCLSNVDDLTLGVLVEVHPWIGRNRFDLLIEIHLSPAHSRVPVQLWFPELAIISYENSTRPSRNIRFSLTRLSLSC